MRKQLAGVFAAVALFIAGPLMAQDEDLFAKLDANKDGFITADEVQESQKALFERLLRNADKDGDKKLSKAEFQAGLKPDEAPRQPLAGGQGFAGRPGAGNGDLREIFNRLDANKDGKLSQDESPPFLKENFARLDANNDGSISPEEFAQVGRFGRPPGAPANPNQTPSREMLEALFDRTDSNSDGKLSKDEIPEERQGMRAILERSGGDSLTKEQFVRGMLAMAQANGQPPRPERVPPRAEGAPARPDGAPMRRPEGPPGAPPGGGLFGLLDTDRDGQLSTSEIVGAGSVLLKLDKNGDGKLTPDEVFGPGGAPGRPGDAPSAAGRPGQRGLGGMNPEEFRARLKEADTNKDGKISKEEAPALLKDRFERVDANGDGFVDEEEIRELLRRMADNGGKAPIRRPKPNNN
jgi:Ca2+-binding EF-hand superfamily protein